MLPTLLKCSLLKPLRLEILLLYKTILSRKAKHHRTSITLLYMLLPKLRIPAILSAASFTIYLYHDLGTSGARRVAQAMGLESVWLILAIACVVGFLLPIAAHLVFSRFAFTRVLCLGLKAR